MATHQDSKHCPQCGRVRPRTEFSPRRGAKREARSCIRCYRALRKTANANYNATPKAKAIYRRNAARYRKANPEKTKAALRQWQRDNREYGCEKAKEWAASHPERVKERQKKHGRRHMLKHHYGLTIEQFDAMRAAQNNHCAICERPFTKMPQVDHDHATGLVRGLLCMPCNLRLGFYEMPGFLDACASYLDRHERSKAKVG